MKNVELKKLISISLLSLVLVSCSSSTENESVIYDDPGDDIIVDDNGEELSPEDAQALADETSKQSRATYLEAYINADTETCEKIESEDLKYSCVQSALTQKAIKEGNIKICDELESKKGQQSCEDSYERAQVPEDETAENQ